MERMMAELSERFARDKLGPDTSKAVLGERMRAEARAPTRDAIAVRRPRTLVSSRPRICQASGELSASMLQHGHRLRGVVPLRLGSYWSAHKSAIYCSVAAFTGLMYQNCWSVDTLEDLRALVHQADRSFAPELLSPALGVGPWD